MKKQELKEREMSIELLKKRAVSLMKSGNISAYIKALITLEKFSNRIYSQVG